VSLLGNCGLLVPAAAASVPAQDSYFLRAASYDAPAEGLSAFAVEMLDVATILRDSTRATLVLVDELGAYTHTRTHTRARAHTHTRTHTHRHTHTHTHTYTHDLARFYASNACAR